MWLSPIEDSFLPIIDIHPEDDKVTVKVKARSESAVIHKEATDTTHQILWPECTNAMAVGLQTDAEAKKIADK